MPNLRPEFLLFFVLLLFIGIVFWKGGDLLTKQLLSFSYRTLDRLYIDTFPQVILKLDFTINDINIYLEQELTKVDIKTGNSMLKNLELEIPNSRFSEEAITRSAAPKTIAQELKLDPQIKKLELQQRIKVEIPVDLTGIKARIEKEKGFSYVEVRTVNSTLKKLNFVLPIAEVHMLEVRIAQLLNLSLEDVRILTSYQVKNQSPYKRKREQGTGNRQQGNLPNKN